MLLAADLVLGRVGGKSKLMGVRQWFNEKPHMLKEYKAWHEQEHDAKKKKPQFEKARVGAEKVVRKVNEKMKENKAF